MSRIAEVAAALRRIAEMLPLALLDKADDNMRDAASLMVEVGQGSSRHELADTTAAYAWAQGEIQELSRKVLSARAVLLTLADRLDSHTGSTGTPRRSGTRDQPGKPRPTRDQRIKRARQSLPDGVRGTQTQGRWLGPGDDTTVVRSGHGDQWHDQVKDFVAELPRQHRAAMRLATHIEIKFAMRMREEGLTDETIVIDREVCGRREDDQDDRWTCDRFLPWFLPRGPS
jgi:SCP1.201-like deaminase